MSHYFTNDYVKSEEKNINVIVNNIKLKFIVDNGVFSKKGLDFGTRTLLENIDLNKIKGDILDFGSGYGPIGIYLKKVTNANVDMIDINERALKLVAKNAALNNVKVNIFKSNIYENINKKYDAIVTNPPIRVGKKILYEILFGAKDHLKDDGTLWLVINKNSGAKSLAKDLEKIYDVTIIKKNKGFYIICAKKRWLFEAKPL